MLKPRHLSKKQLLVSLAISFCLVLLGIMFWLSSALTAPLALSSEQLFTVDKGASVQKVCRQFKQSDWLEECLAIRVMAKFDKDFAHIQSGTYKLTPNMTVEGAFELFRQGQTYSFSFTIVEGENVFQVLDKVSRSDFLVDDTASMTLTELSKKLSLKYDSPEGFWAPDTYFVEYGTEASALLQRATNKQLERLEQVWSKAQPSVLKNKYELLKLASIVEKESAHESERATIASVFFNRLNKRMRLQTDPTVIYGVWDEYQGDIKREHLKRKTPFNTYRINGLPPTPIANPSINSMLAVAQPADTDYLYFVASGTGGHTFSRTLKEHNLALKRYLAIEKEKNN